MLNYTKNYDRQRKSMVAAIFKLVTHKPAGYKFSYTNLKDGNGTSHTAWDIHKHCVQI